MRFFSACVFLLCATLVHAEPDYRIETVAEGLEHPWSIAFLPDGRMLVTERAGRLRVIDSEGRLAEAPVAGVPNSHVSAQAGLFEVLPHPRFSDNKLVYLSLAHGDRRANDVRVVRGQFDGERLTDVEVLFAARPERATSRNLGGRMLFLPDETLLISVGDGFDYRDEAQNPGSHLGSIVRIHDDGSVPDDNPLRDESGARPEIYTWGHRNIQGLVLDPETGRIWSNEHGPRGGDELNVIEGGENYGWPAATHGIDYTGEMISPHRELPGKVPPLHVWTPAIAPAGLMFYTGDMFPEWQGSLFNAGLVSRSVQRLEVDALEVVTEESLFEEVGARIRDVRQAPDGSIYLLTDARDGRVLRIARTAQESD